jgi:hopanoid biosynthesis associated RND transporter like protein HpnN
VEVGVTGKDVLDADEMGMAQRDTALATVISVLGVALLYVGLFRGWVRPLLALATLLIAVCWALGLTTLTIGHLNVLSIVFLPMLMGLGIDYGSYFIARYEEERGTGEGLWEALLHTFVATGPGIATTALTTALTFGALLLTGFKGIAELGFIGGSGILLAALATFTVLPALLALQARRGHDVLVTSGTWRAARRRGYLAPLYRHPWATLLASALLAGVSLLALGQVGADFNLLHLQAEGAESVAWVQKIFHSSKRSMLFGELVGDSLEEVTRKAEALKSLPSVAEVESVASVIPADQERKRPLIEALRPLLADISLQGGRSEPVDVEALRSSLERIRMKMMEDSTVTEDADGGSIRQEMAEVHRLITQFLDTTGQMWEVDVHRALSVFQEDLRRDLAEQLAVLEANLGAEPVTLADLPLELRNRYIGASDKYRLFVYPAADIWEFQPLARFVTEVRSVDPDVLGTPITNFEFTREIAEAYEQAGLYAFLGITCLAFLMFRAMRPALLALIPLVTGSLWTLGFMGLFQVKFNVANLMVLPLIMAPAVESGIMIISRYREERSRSRLPLPLPKSTGQAVVFSSLSTIVGFGSLMISRHQGIFSIGLLLTYGVGSVLLASLTVLPSLLALLSASKRARTQGPAARGTPLTRTQPIRIELLSHLWQLPVDRPPRIQRPDACIAIGAGAMVATDGEERQEGSPERAAGR